MRDTRLVRIRKDILQQVEAKDWRTPTEVHLDRNISIGVKVDRALQKALRDSGGSVDWL